MSLATGMQHIYLSPTLTMRHCHAAVRLRGMAELAMLLSLSRSSEAAGLRVTFAFCPVDSCASKRRRRSRRARLEEELEALAILAAQSQTYAYLDCIYRQDALRRRWLYDGEEAIFGPVDASDDSLVDELAHDLMELAPTPGTCRIYAPLAVGNHVDHQVAHRSASASTT